VSPAIDRPVFDFVTKTSRFNGTLRRGKTIEGPPSYASVLALFDRCCSLLGAIRVLLYYDFVYEAIILARPLFTDSLALAEIAAADDKGRDELAVRLNMAGVAQGEGLFRSAKPTGVIGDDELRSLAEERAEIEEYARRKGLHTKGWQPDHHAKSLADKHGRSGEYLDLRVADHFVHGSTKATSQRFKTREDGTIVVSGEAREFDTWANPTGLFAVHSALCAARAACRIFGWAEPPELDALMRELAEARVAEDARCGGRRRLRRRSGGGGPPRPELVSPAGTCRREKSGQPVVQ
jgi:Family of unknown function (DUF5677)